MISLPELVVVNSGSVPRRPTRVSRASWEGRDMVKVRVRKAEEEESGAKADLRREERRKDMFRGLSGRRPNKWSSGGGSFGIRVFKQVQETSWKVPHILRNGILLELNCALSLMSCSAPMRDRGRRSNLSK